MDVFRNNIWDEGEYTYEAAYGFEPNIRAFIHEDEEVHDAILVVPGGGYCMVVPNEAWIIAEQFYNRGMNAFVLTYTTDITFAVPLKMQPLKDISRAMRVIRYNAEKYHINPDKLAVCGFSAGGHVSASLATHWQDIEEPAGSKYAEISNKPTGVILSYPVITTGKYTHEYSILALLGKDATEEELEYFSLEKQVSDKTPPCFIWQTRTDDLVPVENSYLFAESLHKHDIPYSLYVFPHGPHGLGVATEDYFLGNMGEIFTFEQLDRAVAAVKDGDGVNVSEQRVAELLEQFPDEIDDANETNDADTSDANAAGNEKPEINLNPYPEVRMWPELAYQWICNL